MGIINESADRLKKNVEHMNRGEAIHPVHAHMHVASPKVHVEKDEHAGEAMYKRFYGGKKP